MQNLTRLSHVKNLVDDVRKDNQIFDDIAEDAEFFVMSQKGNVNTPNNDLNNKTIAPYGPKLLYKIVESNGNGGEGLKIDTSSLSSPDISSFYNESRVTIAFGQPADYVKDISALQTGARGKGASGGTTMFSKANILQRNVERIFNIKKQAVFSKAKDDTFVNSIKGWSTLSNYEVINAAIDHLRPQILIRATLTDDMSTQMVEAAILKAVRLLQPEDFPKGLSLVDHDRPIALLGSRYLIFTS